MYVPNISLIKYYSCCILGAFYWVLGNLHPKYRSSLKMLNLAILCRVKWIKQYGMEKVLNPLMADLKLLESVCKY